MRSAAEIRKLILRVDGQALGRVGDRLAVVIEAAVYQVIDQFQLVRLVVKDRARFRRRHLAHGKFMTAGQDLFHPLFDPLDIVVADRLRQFKIVVKAVLDRRADGDLCLREAFQHRLRQHMGGRMSDLVQLAVFVTFLWHPSSFIT